MRVRGRMAWHSWHRRPGISSPSSWSRMSPRWEIAVSLWSSVSSKAFQRLGSGPAGSCEVKNHPWLKCLNWDEVSSHQNYHHHDTHCQVDSGCLRPPIIPDLRCPGDSDQYPEYGEDMWWHDHQDNRETSQYHVLQVGCAWAAPGWQRQVHWILRRRGKCEDCDSNNCEDQILKTFLNSLH